MVSVIIPVYNGAEFLEECLRSITNQTYRDLEIIVINDGSVDASCQICEKFAREDSRIILIQQDNSGVSVARNNGMTAACGEYIVFVDADDIVPPTAIELLVSDIETSDADMSIGAHEAFRGAKRNKITLEKKRYLVNDLRQNIFLAKRLLQTPWGRIYKREIIVEHNLSFLQKLPYGEDTRFNLEYCEHIRLISTFSEVVYQYRLGGIASSVKFYPDKTEMTVKLVNSYDKFLEKGDTIDIKGRQIVVKDALLDCFCHYIVHTPQKIAIGHIGRTLRAFRLYLTETVIVPEIYKKELADSILNGDSSRIYALVYRDCFLAIKRKKIKRFYYRFFTKRI